MISALLMAAAIVGHTQVVDGDTLRVDGVRIRLFGIDSPEAGEECVASDESLWKCGREATEELRREIAGRDISCDPVDHDKYGRTVAICTVDGKDLQAWLTSRGLAKAFTRYSRRYVSEEAAAKRARLGIWR